MRILTVEPKDIHVTADFSYAEIKHILNWAEKAHPLYQKVYTDENTSESSYVQDVFINSLRVLADDIEKGMKNGS